MAAEESSTAPDGQPEPERSDGPAVQGRAPAPGPSSAEERGGIRWIEGSADADANVGSRDGLRWSWELDLGELLSAAGLVQAGVPGDLGEVVDQEASLAAEQELIEASGGREQGRDLTGQLAEYVPAGPGLAAWLAAGPAGEWSDWDLPGVAAAFRRVASWAQAGELAAVAAIASRTAERDPKVGTAADGRPAGLAPSAVAEVSLALSMSHAGASWWAGLGVALQWRLAATGRALAAGQVDVSRARLISEATAVLSDELAQAVEARVLPDAGHQTTGELRAALRRAVIAVDPRGADDRRRDAELQADVRLYPDDAGTATLAGVGLPAVHAAAMMARLTALARGLRASGEGGRLGLLRAYALTGLVLGTMPLIPGAGPDAPPGPDGPPDPDSPAGPDAPPARPAPPDLPGGPPWPPRGTRRTSRLGPAENGPDRDGSGPAGSEDADADRSSRGETPASGPSLDRPSGRSSPAQPTWPGGSGAELDGPGEPADPDGSWRDVPPPGDDDMPPPGGEPAEDPWVGPEYDPYDTDRLAEAPGPAWPPLPTTVTQIPPLYGNAPDGNAPDSSAPDSSAPPGSPAAWPLAPLGPGLAGGRPPPGRLDLTISWPALAGQSDTAATLSRIGPVTAAQALPLAVTAAADRHTTWRVVLVGSDGRARAVEHVRRPRVSAPAGPPGTGPTGTGPTGTGPSRPLAQAPGVTGRVTVTFPVAALAQPPPSTSGTPSPGCPGSGILTATWRAALRAAAKADAVGTADAAAPGGCAHTAAASGYRPPPRIREYVNARAQTCRQPTCRQPAHHADLDHTIPYDQGGRTCTCNTGPHCRTHHQIKQQPGWTLIQPRPGTFHLTTPAGRTYTTYPDPYPT